MSDWYQPRDKGPVPEKFEQEWNCEPYKRPKKKKEFIIERRYVGPKRRHLTEIYEEYREWHNHRRYRDEGARQEAFTTLTRRQGKSYPYYDLWEYRIHE